MPHTFGFLEQSQEQLAKLTAKMLYEVEYIEPVLGEELFPYYRHYCVISAFGNNYSQKGFGIYDYQTSKYDRIGHVLRHL
ncbi:hypothetical protein [Microcoleus asticus]|uniref:Uncharacterized protein n=1 Tax=Microcoleus asticus IPMA8 TaxID=2563858 RepID=A0ABX2D6H9_9CYAN|nr:hypothetical protein [Microcoleus asticus]NQE38153.1 hypothetical protein [Microcoleus asticus IPMA8]